MDTIISLQNEKVKLAKGLQSRARTRRKERKITLEGTRLIIDAIECGHKPLFILYDIENADRTVITYLEDRKHQLLPVNDEVLRYVSDTPHPQGIIGVFPLPVPPLPHKPSRVLILDSLGDPGNMGTILRTAAAANVQVVLLSPECADPYNPKTLRSGMGAHFRIPVIEAKWEQIARYCEPLNVYLAAGNGDLSYDEVDWQAGWAVIIGNEAHGVSAETENIPSKRVYIPMSAKTESLNAAVAAGILLFEAARQNK